MKIEKQFLVAAGVAVVLAVPVAIVLNGNANQLKIERSQNNNLQLEIKSVEKQLQEQKDSFDVRQKESEGLKQESESLKQENTQLKSDLQAKRDKQEQEKIAAHQTPKASVAVSGSDCGLAKSLIAKYDWPQDDAYKIMQGESGCNPSTANLKDSHPWANCVGSFGLFQINCSHGQVYDAAQNVAIAYSKFVQNGKTFCTTSGWTNTCKKMGVN